jgi:hypothetical protein
MATGLQIHEHLRSPGPLPRFPQGLNLGMRAARFFMVALGDNAAVFHDNGPDHGVGRGSARRFSGQFQSPPHPLFLMFLFQNFAIIVGNLAPSQYYRKIRGNGLKLAEMGKVVKT